MMEEERLRTARIMEDRDAARLQRLRMQESMIRQQIAERQVSTRAFLQCRRPKAASLLTASQ